MRSTTQRLRAELAGNIVETQTGTERADQVQARLGNSSPEILIPAVGTHRAPTAPQTSLSPNLFSLCGEARMTLW